MIEPLLPPRFLLRLAAPCRYAPDLWPAKGLDLDESYRLPNFGGLDGQQPFADVRAAWNENGLAFAIRIDGKRQTPWCRETQMDESDGLNVWIDTRDTHNIHRASRFCHRFAFLPTGGGRRRDSACGGQLLIDRAKEHPKPATAAQLKVRSEKRINGYLLEACIKAGALTGFDPDEHPRLGFTYVVFDREFGEQTFSVGSSFPIADDPSLWGTLELVR